MSAHVTFIPQLKILPVSWQLLNSGEFRCASFRCCLAASGNEKPKLLESRQHGLPTRVARSSEM